ncbi:MAG TPA: glycosyltransferase family 39 protein [Candidatus Paceibacterota bacterium]
MKYWGLFVCSIVLGVGAFMLLHNLGVGPLAQYDEGTYATVVHESFVRHDFLTFTYFGNLFFEKPPLYFWLAGVATFITNNPILGIRLPAALAALATVALIMYMAYAFSREWWVAALAGMYLVSIEPFVQGAREARLDAVIGFFILLAFWFAWERKYVWLGVAVALAILTKSVVAIFAIAALPIVMLWRREYQGLTSLRVWQGVALGLVLVLPWHLYEWVLYGNKFWFSYIGVNVLERYQSNLFANPYLQTDYWGRLLDYARPQLGLFLLSLIIAVAYARGSRYVTVLGSVLSLIAIMVVVFFTAQTRALSYLLPLYPFAALFFALSASLFLQRCRAKVWHDQNENPGSNS